MQEFITEHIMPQIGAFVGVVLTGVAGFFFGKRKLRAETETIEVNNDTIEISNADKIVGMYQKTLDDLQVRYEAKFKEIINLYEEKIKLLQDEISILRRTNKQLKEENEILRKNQKKE